MRILVLLISFFFVSPVVAQNIFCYPTPEKVEQAFDLFDSRQAFVDRDESVASVSGCQWGRPTNGVWSGRITSREFERFYRSSAGWHLIDRFTFAGVATPWYASASFYDVREWRHSTRVGPNDCHPVQIEQFGGCLIPTTQAEAWHYIASGQPRLTDWVLYPVRIPRSMRRR